MTRSPMTRSFEDWKIVHEFLSDNLSGDSGVDFAEMASRYAAVVLEELEEEFPGAEIEVEYQLNTSGAGGMTRAFGPDDEEIDLQACGPADPIAFGMQQALDRAGARIDEWYCLTAEGVWAEFEPVRVDGSYDATICSVRFELYWDDQDPSNEGWWLRYVYRDGQEDGESIDGGGRRASRQRGQEGVG